MNARTTLLKKKESMIPNDPPRLPKKDFSTSVAAQNV